MVEPTGVPARIEMMMPAAAQITERTAEKTVTPLKLPKSQNDDDGNDDGDQQVIAVGGGAGGFGKCFIKSDSKDLIVKQDKDRGDQQRQHRAEDHFPFGQRKDRCRAEKRTADISRKVRICREDIHDQITDRHGPDGDHGDRSISLDLRILSGAEKQDRADDGDRKHQQHLIGQSKYRGNGHSAESNVGKAVSDEGKAFQDQCHPQERGAERDQYADDQGVSDERKLEVKRKFFNHNSVGSHSVFILKIL